MHASRQLNSVLYHGANTALRHATRSTRSTRLTQYHGAQLTAHNWAPVATFSSFAEWGSRSGRPRNPLPVNWGVRVVPEQRAWVVERFGKFHRVLKPGLRFLVPLVDRVSYVQSLKEEAIAIPNQTAITMDNVTIEIDGVLYLKIVDAVKASYGIEDVYFAMTQLAQTTMRSELGQITLDKTFAERTSLNNNIVRVINEASFDWGVECLRYEIRDISPPASVKHAMDMQAEAERKKRATILDSEGAKQAEINNAEGAKQAVIMEAEAEAEGTLAKARATAEGIGLVAAKISETKGGSEAVAMRVAEKYVEAFSNIAKEGNTVLLPANAADPASMVAQALAIFKSVNAAESGATANNSQLPTAEYSVRNQLKLEDLDKNTPAEEKKTKGRR